MFRRTIEKALYNNITEIHIRRMKTATSCVNSPSQGRGHAGGVLRSTSLTQSSRCIGKQLISKQRNVSFSQRRAGLICRAVAAPVGDSNDQVAFTAWDTAVQRVAKRTDLKTIMLLGAGPIVIGQVCVWAALGWPCV